MSVKPKVGTTRSDRVSRTPVSGKRNILTIDDRLMALVGDDYVPRWVNDSDGRIQTFLQGGYEFVEDSHGQVGDPRAGEAAQQGSIVNKPVGGGVTAYLMKIKRAYFDEDQAAKMEKIREVQEQIGSLTGGSEHGQIGDGFYGSTMID